ncbi:MAG: hypothetical protein ACTHKG_06860 [Nocardioides sp.]
MTSTPTTPGPEGPGPARSTAVRRPVPLPLLAVVALVAALATTLTATGHADPAEAHSRHAAVPGPTDNARQQAFHDRMRKLWEDHVTWTRLAIVAFADDSPGFDAAAARLLRNQRNIGDAIKPFYGDAAGDRLTSLLSDHIAIAVELLQAARAGDTAKVEDASRRWYANSDDIADFLAGANSRYWPRKEMRAAMRMHLDQTLAEAQDELTGHYARSVRDYDAIHRHILGMADVLSNGILQAFPGRFR